jgi:hypothetical protein
MPTGVGKRMRAKNFQDKDAGMLCRRDVLSGNISLGFESIFFSFVCIACLFLGELSAVERSPWLDPLADIHLKTTYTHQHYTKLDHAGNRKNFCSEDNLYLTEARVSPWARWDGAVDLLAASTRLHGFSLRHFGFAVRHLLTDEAIGDCLSNALSMRFILPTNKGRNDFSLFYHGDIDAELSLSSGREFYSSHGYLVKLWNLAGLGVSNQGAPWILEEVHFSAERCALSFGGNLSLRKGFGRRDLLDVSPFQGYGNVDYCILDLGLGLGYAFSNTFFTRGAFEQRFFELNAPHAASKFSLALEWAFSF